MIIMKEKYVSYDDALKKLNLQNLDDRRTMLATRFAKKCTQHERFSDLFPLNKKKANTRSSQKYQVKYARTQSLYKSAIPTMQRILNGEK